MAPLSTGNVVITSPYDDAGGTDAGAVYLFNGATGALISTLTGSAANDKLGNLGVTVLSNGNYVVRYPNWDNAGAVDAGAVIWGSGTTGVNGAVTSINSLVGTTANDQVGNTGVTALKDGNYVVRTASWDNVGVVDVGAVTWGSGTTGVSGAVSSSNSLIGTTAYDQVGRDYNGLSSVTELSNGNYVVRNLNWDNAGVADAGAVTWGNGSSGVSGVINSSNSLVGSTAGDQVGYNNDNFSGVTALNNGNYVVASRLWNNASVVDAGAVTWGNGIGGVSGVINSSNSLVGTKPNDRAGNGGVMPLTNGNYVVSSVHWDNVDVMNSGAVTWGNGTSGVTGVISSDNSLVGTKADDGVGYSVTALSNGNYVVCSPNWGNAGVLNAGAVTWGNGTTGVSGPVTISNSLVGTKTGDTVGYSVTALTNGNYVVSSPYWGNAGVVNAGAVTWGNGTTGVSGPVTISNSLVGTTLNDKVGADSDPYKKMIVLSNGNYVVVSSEWNNYSGAVTWGSGTAGVKGAVSSINSLVGTTAYDQVGHGVTVLSNGNYVVRSPYWNNTGVVRAGAVTWGNGSSGVKGAVSSINSLVGTTAYDGIGYPSVTALPNGNYVVGSSGWHNAGVEGAGAVTWCSGISGVSGTVSSINSLVGTTRNDRVSGDDTGFSISSVLALSNGNYVVRSRYWHNDGIVDAGTVTWGNGTSGVSGEVSSSNSLVGLTEYTNLQTVVVDDVNSTYIARFLGEGSGKVRLGSQVDGLIPNLPGIEVAYASPLTDSVGVVSLGSEPVGSGSAPFNFTVTNPSNSKLTNLVVTKDGPGSADFAVSTLSATSIPVGAGTATFSVTFSPSSIGVKTATLHIASNVIGSKNPFDISITGTGRIASQIPQTLVFAAPLKLYLAESPFTLSANASSGLPVAFTVLSGPASVSGNVLTFTGAGLVKLRATQTGNADFLAATPVERTITVAANPTTLTLTNLIQTYTGTRRPITVLGATGPVDVTYKVGLVYVPTAPINAGSYPVKAVAGGITKTGTLIITKAPLFVQPDDQRTFAGQANPVLGFSYSGFLGSENAANSVSKAPVIATTATATSAGGLYPITASGGTSANYLFVYLKGAMKVETFAASYEALLVDAGRPAAKLELTVTASSKTFTAKLTTPTTTTTVSLPGTLTTNSLTETATGIAALTVGVNTYLVTVTLPLVGDFTAEAKRNGTTLGTATNGRKLLTLATGQTLSYIGTHSALLAPATAGAGVPAGAGWAVATIDAKGLLKLAGKLADGTTLTASLPADVSSNPGYRLFLQPYTPARTGAFLAGAFTLKPHPDVAGRRFVAFEDAADLTWVKAPRTLDTSYRAGFGPVVTRFTLDPWLPPVAAKVGVPAITLTNRLGLTAPQFTAKHSTISSASFADLPESVGLNATSNVVSVIAPPANTTKWKVTITPTTGAFVGSFVLTDAGKARTVPFAGMMRQPPSTDTSGLIGDGNFLLPALTPAPNNEILSGEIGLER